MKILDVKVGETVAVHIGNGRKVLIVPKRKSGAKIRIGVVADEDIIIDNPSSLAEEGMP